MAETSNHALPLVAAAQAQKHVTVNEALARIDAFLQLRISEAGAFPPDASDGSVFIVPDEAFGPWEGQGGRLAIASNGGWTYADPGFGMRAFNLTSGKPMIYDGAAWQEGAVCASEGGAATIHEVVQTDHSILPGAANATEVLIPAKAQVSGVTARVVTGIAGPVTWRLGVDGAEDRYGSGLGVAPGSYVEGVTGQPVVYWTPTALKLQAEGAPFESGTVRIVVHFTRLVPPRP